MPAKAHFRQQKAQGDDEMAHTRGSDARVSHSRELGGRRGAIGRPHDLVVVALVLDHQCPVPRDAVRVVRDRPDHRVDGAAGHVVAQRGRPRAMLSKVALPRQRRPFFVRARQRLTRRPRTPPP